MSPSLYRRQRRRARRRTIYFAFGHDEEVGGADARHYATLTDAIYRFLPIHLPLAALRLHAADERLPIDVYSHAIAFYHRLLQNSDVLGEEDGTGG